MPTYQYACTACGHQLEAVQSFSDAALTDCPECQGRLRKVFSAVGVVFKGSGFYRNDSRATPAKTKGTTESSTESGGSAGGDGGTSADKGTSKDGGADRPAAAPKHSPAKASTTSSTAGNAA